MMSWDIVVTDFEYGEDLMLRGMRLNIVTSIFAW